MASVKRTTFYDEHPFDWVAPDSDAEIRSVVSPLLVDLIETLDSRTLVLDVGCGPGRVLQFLAKRGIRCIGADRSSVSLNLAVKRYGCPGALSDNLSLPFADEVADVVVSDGVIHHTDDPYTAFTENLRILKPGGRMYLGVYKSSGRYPLLYTFPGGMIRRALNYRWGLPLVVAFAMVPYFLVHFVRSRGRRTWAGAHNLFYDYFVTPRVAFIGREVIEQWCAKSGVRMVRYEERPGSNVHSFLLQKTAALKQQGQV